MRALAACLVEGGGQGRWEEEQGSQPASRARRLPVRVGIPGWKLNRLPGLRSLSPSPSRPLSDVEMSARSPAAGLPVPGPRAGPSHVRPSAPLPPAPTNGDSHPTRPRSSLEAPPYSSGGQNAPPPLSLGTGPPQQGPSVLQILAMGQERNHAADSMAHHPRIDSLVKLGKESEATWLQIGTSLPARPSSSRQVLPPRPCPTGIAPWSPTSPPSVTTPTLSSPSPRSPPSVAPRRSSKRLRNTLVGSWALRPRAGTFGARWVRCESSEPGRTDGHQGIATS